MLNTGFTHGTLNFSNGRVEMFENMLAVHFILSRTKQFSLHFFCHLVFIIYKVCTL